MNLDDQRTILQLVADYGSTWDAYDVDAFCSLFWPDAIMHTYIAGGANPVLVRRSTEERRAYMHARRAELERRQIQPRHYQTNTVLTEIEDGIIAGRSMVFVTHQRRDESGPKMVMTGMYVDEFRRIDGVWKFSRRDQYLDVALPDVPKDGSL